MTNNLAFQYFIREESEQFTFIKVPKIFFKNRRFDFLSYGAKILYGLLLDRMSLSRKNEWIDEKKRVYVIYTIKNIQEDFNVSKTVAVKFMQELEELGLIEKKRRPNAAALIYVKNFILQEDSEMEELQEMQKEQGSIEYGPAEVQKVEVQNIDSQKDAGIQESSKSGLPEYGLPEVQNMESNKTNINKTDIVLSSSSNHIYNARDDDIREQIMICVNYDNLVKNKGIDKQLAKRVLECLVALFTSKTGEYKMDNSVISVEEVRKKIREQLSEGVFKEVIENILHNGAGTIYNLQNYVITCFYKITVVRNKKGCGWAAVGRQEYNFEELEKKLLAN